MLSWLRRVFSGSKPNPAPKAQTLEPLASFDDLNTLIDACGLENAREAILRHAKPCFHMIAGKPAAGAPLGGTRLGGAPDLAAGTAWPRGDYGYCGFLGQLDLADVRTRTGCLDLPAEGLLSLFVDYIESAGDPVPVRAILTPAGTALERLAAPEGEEAYGAYVNRLKPVSIEAFRPGVTVPVMGLDLHATVEALAPDGDFERLQDAVSQQPTGAIGRLLGQGFDHDGSDLRLALHARQIGREGLERFAFIKDWDEWLSLKRIESRLRNGTIYRPWTDDQDDQVRYFLDNRDAFFAGADALRLLVLIESNRAMDMWINDADPIFLFIPAANLAKGDFTVLFGAVTQG